MVAGLWCTALTKVARIACRTASWRAPCGSTYANSPSKMRLLPFNSRSGIPDVKARDLGPQ